LPLFHCEIEGTFLDTVTLAAIAYLWALFALGVAAVVLGGIFTALGPIGWVVYVAIAVLVILIILLVMLLGALFGGDDTDEVEAGPLGDALPSPTGPIITDTGGNTVHADDFVALIGRPVCDTGHNEPCWDELHPLKAIAKIRPEEYALVPVAHTPGDIFDRYCIALRGFVDQVGRVEQELKGETPAGGGPPAKSPLCLEHPRLG